MKYKGNDITNADWISIIAILAIVISGCLFTYYFIIFEINSCTSDPLEYYITSETNENYTYAILKVYRNKEDIVPIKTLEKDLKTYPTIPNFTKSHSYDSRD